MTYSTGVGRTGTFIAISIALEQAAAEKVVDIAGITNRMRQQRMKMVQSPVRVEHVIPYIMGNILGV